MNKIIYYSLFAMICLLQIQLASSGQQKNITHENYDKKIGQTLLYENSFDKSQDEWTEEMKNDWVMEGKGITRCGNGYLSLNSEIFTVPRDKDGHFNLWLKHDFPANIAIEWDFRYSEPGEEGLAIIIWGAKGRNGEDIFDPSLPVRRGEVMRDFHTGALNCYHTSYIARGRKTANLRKNYGFHILTEGKDLSTYSKPEEWHKIRMEQCNGVIRLLFDGKESYRYFDDGTIGGPVINTGGKMAFRQQNNLHRGDYKNLKIYSLDSCNCHGQTYIPPVKEIDLKDIDPNLFSKEEWFIPYYLNHFADVANSVIDTGKYRGFFDLSVWRGTKNHHTYNARVMEGILSLVWFYSTDRPWNIYYHDQALKLRIEAALDYWCNMQSADGKFSEYGFERWNLAATAFATKFIGRALWLLQKDESPIDEKVFERSKNSLKKTLYTGLTDEALWKSGRNFTNQYANFWSGALMYLDISPDPEIDSLLMKRLTQSMSEFQSPVGFFYERGGPDWGYNLGTHHSDLQAAWEYAKGTKYEDFLIKKTEEWYDWFSYNAVKEPGSTNFYLNRAVETRQQMALYNDKLKNPSTMRWTPQAEYAPKAHPFVMSSDEYKKTIEAAWQNMYDQFPKTEAMKPGEFSAFSPYAFLHFDMIMWFPSQQQKENSIKELPYFKYDRFNHVKYDNRSQTIYSFIKRPEYYAIFNSGKIITEQQRFGLGLIWNPIIGTVLQSQSKSNIAAFGTKAEGVEQVYESENLFPKILIGNDEITPKAGNMNLPEKDITINYKLKEHGEKTIRFKNSRIVVQIQHKGGFTETLPLLIGKNDKIKADKKGITIINQKGKLTIPVKGRYHIKEIPYISRGVEKSLKLIEITAIDKLEYQFIFKKN